MFSQAPKRYENFETSWQRPDGEYGLQEVSFELLSDSRARFQATVQAPGGASPIVRCWVSNAVEGTLAEAEIGSAEATITLEVELQTESIPELACIRIESTEFATEHVLNTRLAKGEIYFLDQLRLELDSVESLKSMLAHMPPEMKEQVSPQWVAMVESATEPTAWLHGFAVFERQATERIGAGGFKGPPRDGQVEIAYSIDEPFRGRGYATTVAKALTNYAFGQSSDITKVIAHTLPEENASTRVLAKSGFSKVCEVEDPEDGLVWRWEREAKNC